MRRAWSHRTPPFRASVPSKKERDHTGSLAFFELNRESVRVRVFEPQAKPAASKTKRPQAKPAAWRSHGLSAAKDGD